MTIRKFAVPLSLMIAVVSAACSGDKTGPGITTLPPDTTHTNPAPPKVTTGPAPTVRASGATLVDATGQVIHLRGVNHSGTEYACVQGWGIFDGQVDSVAVAAMQKWNINAVRVPLNEACWLAINGVKAQYSGATYQQAIVDYVGRLNRAGMVAILDLHWSAPGTDSANKQSPMPNRDHTIEFWKQVATKFASNQSVVFDVFNEPYPDLNQDSPEAWRCWRDGGTCIGMLFKAAGMQELVTEIRNTGAKNLIILGGVRYANSLSQWLQNRPTDPQNNLAASWHVYNFNACVSQSCWDGAPAAVAAQVPLVLGEIGADNNNGALPLADRLAFNNSLMDWMDNHGGNYLAWVWNVWGGTLDVISNYDGTPTTYGQVFKTRFQK